MQNLCRRVCVDRVVQEQCCVAVLEHNMCTTGINVAKEQGACDSLFASTCESKTTKVRPSALFMCTRMYLCVVCERAVKTKTLCECAHSRKSPSTQSLHSTLITLL